MDAQPNHVLLQPYRPTDGDRFDAVKAAHLLNRAGFGGTSTEIGRVLELGPQRAVDWLMDFKDVPAERQGKDVPDLSSIAGYGADYKASIRMVAAGKTELERKAIAQKVRQANGEAIRATVAWWLRRMAYGPHPLQEKLTLFWHGHFTTSDKDERSASLMWRQNELLRANGAGNFRGFVRAVSRDPAMLDYLNNNSNRKQHPNENYARELMELFTLGIGNYTEQDVKEGARAFTGWAHDGDDYVFRKGLHDDGTKQFMGVAGNLNGDDVIDVILSKPMAARFIAGKLFRFFAHDDPDDAVVNALGKQLQQNKYELRPTLRTILTSRAFYSPDRRRVANQEPGAADAGHDPAGGSGDAARRRAAVRPEGDGPGAVPAAQRPRVARRADVDQHQHAAGAVQHGHQAAGRPAAADGRQPPVGRPRLGRPGPDGRPLADAPDPAAGIGRQEAGAGRRRRQGPRPRGRRAADGAADRGDAGVPVVLKRRLVTCYWLLVAWATISPRVTINQ